MKDRVIEAMKAYSERQKKKPKRKLTQREEPVVHAIQYWAKTNGLMLKRYESKAIKRTVGGRTIWRTAGLDYGTPDLMGTGKGYSVAIEVKAPGRLSTLRPKQREFLVDLINAGGFGVVADDAVTLGQLWAEFLDRKANGFDTTRWLLEQLPEGKNV